MSDEAGMTASERAAAYEVEAGRMIDRTIRKLPDGVETAASLQLVKLIVEAAVLRSKEPRRCLATIANMEGGIEQCGLLEGHSQPEHLSRLGLWRGPLGP